MIKIFRTKKYKAPNCEVTLQYLEENNDVIFTDIDNGLLLVKSKYPYNLTKSHLILFYEGDYYKSNIVDIVESYSKEGYLVLMNAQNEKSIPGISHFHFLKY